MGKKFKAMSALEDYKLHIVVVLIVIASEFLGIRKFSIGHFGLVTMPLFYAMLIGLGLYLFKPFKMIGEDQSQVAQGILLIFIAPLIAKLAVSSGQSIDIIFELGPAFLLKEFGNLFIIVFALPIALLLGFKRETIGMSTSICREVTMGIIIDRYGTDSDEFKGLLSVYFIGTIIGSVFIGFLVSLFASYLPFHPYAMAIACGVGSASMSASAVAPLMQLYPVFASHIEAFAGCSNLISFIFGIYLFIFVSIPFAEFLYRHLEPILGKVGKFNYGDDDGIKLGVSDESLETFKDKFFKWAVFLLLFSLIACIANFVAHPECPFHDAFIGMVFLSLIGIISMVLEQKIPVKVSSLLYASLIALLLALPISPVSDVIAYYVSQINLSSICTVLLGYIGIAIGKDWYKLKKIGWRGILITMFVIAGSYFGTALIAQIVLMFSGTI